MKKALFIHPDYSVPGIDQRTKYVLTQCGLLPPDLGEKGYTPDGFEVDCGILSKILGPGFDVRSRCSEVTRQDFLKELEWLVTEDTQVAVLFFSGHGENELGTVHGSLVCSFNQHVSEIAIRHVVEKSGFKGTLIVILHMCEAAGVACTSEAPSLKGMAQRDAAKVANSSSLTSSREYFNVTLLATGSPFDKAFGGRKGSKFMAALGSLFAKEEEQQRPVTYERLGELLNQYWPTGGVSYPLLRPAGVFGSAARFPNVVAKHASEDKQRNSVPRRPLKSTPLAALQGMEGQFMEKAFPEDDGQNMEAP